MAIKLEELTDEDFIGEDRLNSWRVTQEDIDRLASLFMKLKEKPKVLDVGCGSGLVSYLLAKKGCEVYGFAHESHDLWKKIRHPNLTLRDSTLIDYREALEENKKLEIPYDFNVVYCSWMPHGKDWSSLFYKQLEAPLVVHVIGKGGDKGGSGVTGIQEGDHALIRMNVDQKLRIGCTSYEIKNRYPEYQIVEEWKVQDFRDFTKNSKNKKSKHSVIRVDAHESVLDRF